MASNPPQKTVLVTGANGFIGRAVVNVFSAVGFKTYGLVRRESAATTLAASEVIPIIGSPGNLTFLPQLLKESPTFDVIVSCTEQISNYVEHYEEIINLLRSLSKSSNESGVRPLVLFTSGCKDYGKGTLVDDPALAAHTEESPIAPEPWAEARAKNALRIFDHSDLFDAVLFRPVTLYGYDGSYYGPYFDLAEKAKQGSGILELPTNPKTVLHGMHSLDVATGYLAVALAERKLIAEQVFNLSGRRYETAEEIANALVKEYDLKGVEFVEAREDDDWASKNAQFTQWVSSDKIRKLLGWSDRKLSFTEGLRTYRLAYEAASEQGHEGVAKIKRMSAPKT